MDETGGLMPRDLVGYLSTLVDYPVVHLAQGQPMPDMPDQLIAVTMTGGGGLMLEGAYDRLTFQARCRGDQNSTDAGDDMARALDAALLTTHMPTINQVPTLGFTRTGSGPTPLATDDGQRPTTACTYMVRAASVL